MTFYNDQLLTDPDVQALRREARRSRRGGIALAVIAVTTSVSGLVLFVTRGLWHHTAPASDPVAAQGGSGLPWLIMLAAAYVLVRVAFKTGQYHRGWMHARTIRKSHWAAIQGRGH